MRILTSNIWIYGSFFLSKELYQELSKIYLYKKFWSDWVNFTSVIVGHTKLIFSFFNIYVFVIINKRTVIAKKFFSLKNKGILILFRMLPIRIRYIEPFSKNYDLKESKKYLWDLSTNHFAKRTRPRVIQKLSQQRILNRLSQFYFRNRWTYKTHFFQFLCFC